MLNQEQLISKIKGYNDFVDVEKLKEAYSFAEKVHAQQKRDSGDPYISHPIAVASILAELKLDGPTITTALLHDTLEDTIATYGDVKKNLEAKLQIWLKVLQNYPDWRIQVRNLL
jgi:GTP diphosphokinase / guanosine-3',5'-bis(diphosphate) 3'-diphosphatase